MLQLEKNLMENFQAFLKEYDLIPPEERCMALLLLRRELLNIKKLKPKAITPDLPTEEPDNSLSIGDEHLNTIPETEKPSVKDLVPIPNISITSPKIDFLPEEFADELDLIDPILPRIDEDDFDEEEGEIDIDIFQIKDEILHEKLLNVNLLIDKIKALNLTPSVPFVLEYPSSSPIPVVDSDFLIEKVDTFLVSEDSIPPGIESDFDLEGDIIFLDDLLNDDPIPEYEHFTLDIGPDEIVINNFDKLNEDECFDPGGGVKTLFLTLTSPLRPVASHRDGTFMCFNDCLDFEESRVGVLSIVHSLLNPSMDYIGNLIS
ncbi:hypothetical protein Tco_0032940 [Tanacetum coccineum]